jgi:hypothetical protein
VTGGAIHFLALAALVPAAANPSLLVQGEALELALCAGGSISVPLDNPVPGSQTSACCAKGCQSDEKRKQARRGGAPLES